MSARFAERELRRAKGLPPLEDLVRQLETIDEDLFDAERRVVALASRLREVRAAISELRRDMSAPKTTRARRKGGK